MSNLESSIKNLESVNKKIAKLTLEKEALTKDIISELGHDKEGQKSYEVGIYKITAKTPNIYSLNKSAYVKGDVYLPSEFDPIKRSETFTVDKKLFDQYFNSAPASVREALVQLITVKPGKSSVTVGTL